MFSMFGQTILYYTDKFKQMGGETEDEDEFKADVTGGITIQKIEQGQMKNRQLAESM